MDLKDMQKFLTTISVPVPSKGIVYTIGSPLYKKEDVSVREMTANEEDLLTSLSLIRTGKAIDEVVKACVMDSTFNPEKMLVGDRNSIVAGLILASYGSKYKTDVRCDACGEINKQYEFDINNLPVKWLSQAPIVEGTNEFEFVLPKSKRKITFALSTVEDERDITSTVKRLQSSINKEMNVTTRLKKLILSIDGDYSKEKISNFIEAGMMPIKDSVELRNYIEDISPDIDTKQDFSCQHCGAQNKVAMPIDFSFFWRTSR